MKIFKTFDEIFDVLPLELQITMTKLKSNPERLDFHPEGNTYDHIKIVTERLIQTGDINLIMSGVFHDIGKLTTTKTNPKTGMPCAFGHEVASSKVVKKHADFITEMGGDVEEVFEIVINHMKVKQMAKMRTVKQNALRELKTFPKLEVFTRADSMLKEFIL